MFMEISGRPVDRLLIIKFQICTGAFDNSGGFLDFAQQQYVNELAVSCYMTRMSKGAAYNNFDDEHSL